MLSQLLSSKPKSKVVNLFLAHPQRSFALTEIRFSTNCPVKLLNETIKELSRMGFVLVTAKNKRKFFQINKHFALYPELINLIKKIKEAPKDYLSSALPKVGELKFGALSGVFVGRPRIDSDILLVGKISKAKFEKYLKLAEKLAEGEISYTILTLQEFEYRKTMNDRFVKNILENNPVIVIDKTKNRNTAKLTARFYARF